MESSRPGISWKALDRIPGGGTVIALLLSVGVASLPLLMPGILAGSNLQASLGRIEAVSQGIGRVFPLRIMPWDSLDYGYGAAAFQADACYLLPALLRLAGLGMGAAYKLTLLLVNCATAVIAYRCIRKCLGRREIGVAGSMLYTLCPYRLNEMYVIGNLGDVVAWAFLPIVLCGLAGLYAEENRKEQGRQWMVLTWGFSLLALSSMTICVVAIGMSALLFLVMGRRSWSRTVLCAIGKIVGVALPANAWFLVPALGRMQDAVHVGVLLSKDFQSKGMQFSQYLGVFLWGGRSTSFFENGMKDAQALAPGIAAVALSLLYIWAWYAHRYEEDGQKNVFGKRMVGVCLLMIFLSSNCFPWDLLQDRNMLCSILLSFLRTPAIWGIAVCAGLVLVACLALGQVAAGEEKRVYHAVWAATAAVSLGTARFLLGNLMQAEVYVQPEELGALSFQLIEQEPVAWRISEMVSAVALGAVLLAGMVRRKAGVQRNGDFQEP